MSKEETTYKEVADILTEDFNTLKKANIDFPVKLRVLLLFQQIFVQKKEEQNVKRRVYDALNVLIAANILKKKGKVVLNNGSSLNTGTITSI